MEDETTEEYTDSDYSGDSSFETDDDFDEGLTWDSEDSRPPGPSPQRTESQSSGVLTVSSGPPSPSSFTTVELLSVDLDDSSDTFRIEVIQDYMLREDESIDISLLEREDSQQEEPEQEVQIIEPEAEEEIQVQEEIQVIEVQPNHVPLEGELATDVTSATSSPAAKRVRSELATLNSSTVSDGDDNSVCSICMDPLTNSGKHRVACLRCGHIFGQSCVERWIKVGCNNGARRCPTCNKRACLKDIRVLYLPKVVPLDTTERDRLILEKEELVAQKKVIESDLSRTILQHKLVVEKYEEKIRDLEKRLIKVSSDDLSQSQPGVIVVAAVDISADGGCRVMAFNHLRQELVVSQPSGNTVFAGFGIRILNSVDWVPSRYVLLHSKMVRDLAFHTEDRDLLLSVSLDQTGKLVDLATTTTVHTFKGKCPLWSCCWDSFNPHLLLLGSQMGEVYQYDRRMMDCHVNKWDTDGNKTPVVALASSPCRASSPFPQGGFISCRLNAVYTYSRHGEKYSCQELPLEGPFMSMRYDSVSQTLLTTARPSSRSPHARVCLNLLDSDNNGQVFAPLIHTFNCGSSARVLSRSTMLPHIDDSLVVAHNESGRTLDLWSSKSGKRLHSIVSREPVIDLAPLTTSNHKASLLAALSEKKLTIYRVD